MIESKRDIIGHVQKQTWCNRSWLKECMAWLVTLKATVALLVAIEANGTFCTIDIRYNPTVIQWCSTDNNGTGFRRSLLFLLMWAQSMLAISGIDCM